MNYLRVRLAILFLAFGIVACAPSTPIRPTPRPTQHKISPCWDGCPEVEDWRSKYDDIESPFEDIGSMEIPSASGSGCPFGCLSWKAGCDIKGNKSYDTGEKIYHVPGQTFYNETTINSAYGERWFCTEQEAIANGWRKALN